MTGKPFSEMTDAEFNSAKKELIALAPTRTKKPRRETRIEQALRLVPDVMNVIADGKAPDPLALAIEVGAILRAHQIFHPEEPNTSIPVALLAAIEAELYKRPAQTKRHNEAKKRLVDDEHARIMGAAQKLLTRSPGRSIRKLAEDLMRSEAPPTKLKGGRRVPLGFDGIVAVLKKSDL